MWPLFLIMYLYMGGIHLGLLLRWTPRRHMSHYLSSIYISTNREGWSNDVNDLQLLIEWDTSQSNPTTRLSLKLEVHAMGPHIFIPNNSVISKDFKIVCVYRLWVLQPQTWKTLLPMTNYINLMCDPEVTTPIVDRLAILGVYTPFTLLLELRTWTWNIWECDTWIWQPFIQSSNYWEFDQSSSL